MKKMILLFIVILLASLTYGQDKYLIYFKDKGIERGETLNKSTVLYKQALDNLTERAVERRKKTMGDEVITYEDLPLREDYLRELESRGITIVHKLTWFNAVSAYLNNDQLMNLKNSSFVKKIEAVKKFINKKEEFLNDNLKEIPQKNLNKGLSKYGFEYGESLGQLELCDIPIVHSKGITGEGIILGLLDTGFDWNDHEALVNVNVIAEWDFIYNDSVTANQSGDPSSQHNHGTSVMSEVAGFMDGTLIGASFGSSFLLAKTEDLRWESHLEEDDYAAAMEWMEALGVDVTSSSLGYSEFDDSTYSYTYQDMDGQTTIVTQACELAFSRGVVTITSAGNEGANPWHFITAPADGFNTIAIGAVTSNNVVTSFSSRGPTSDGRIKPDILTQGSGVFAANASGFTNYTSSFGGTSAAAPLACGIAGLLLSAHPHLTNIQVRDILQRTSDNFNTPDSSRGYGLASAQNAINYPNLQFVNDSFKMHKIFINDISINSETVKLNYSVDGGSFQEVDMTFDGNLRYNYIFSDLSNNQQLTFYFTYSDNSSGNYREPESGNYGQLVLSVNSINNVPEDFDLSQNYPNPFNNQTKIEFNASANEPVELIIYNTLGQKVKELFNGIPNVGKNTLFWNGTDEFGKNVSSGIYFYTLKSQGKRLSKKMVLLK